MNTTAANTEDQWEFGPAPLFFVGQPSHLLGHVELHNCGDHRQKLKKLFVRGTNLETAPGARLEALPVSAKLLPNEQKRAPISLQLNPRTPPGVYKGEVHCGKKSRPMTIHVLESWELEVAPPNLSLKVSLGERVTRTIRLSNIGNMPYSIARSAFAILKEKHGLHHAIHASFRKAGATGGQEVLDTFVREMNEREIEPLTVKLKVDKRELQPGESRSIELELAVPKSLRRHRPYVGSIEFENAKVRLDLEIIAPSQRQERKTSS